MKTPRKVTKARSAVVSRKSSPNTPGWISAKDAFKSPKSSSPVRRITRRTSVYLSKTSDKDRFKMPLSKAFSPPGVKTRARRSSIYQKGGGRLISPPKTTRTRRTSMYVTSKPDAVNVFSKVWATPARLPETATEEPKSVPKSSARLDVKSEAASSVSPKKRTKTPRTTNKARASTSKSESPGVKTPKSVRKLRKNVGTELDSQNLSEQKQNETPVSRKKPSPRASPKLGKTPGPKSGKKSPKSRKETKLTPEDEVKVFAKPSLVTSTPTKSLEQITGKSFYATPGETPIQSQRKDDVFVFSAKPVSSAKRSLRKSVQTPKTETPRKMFKSPKQLPISKTPAPTRSIKKVLIESDVNSRLSSPPKKVKATPGARKSERRAVRKSSPEKLKASEEKVKLSPVEMTSVLRSVVESEKQQASMSPSPRQTRRAKISHTEMQTPRIVKTVKRASPKQLAEIVSICQNTNNNGDNDESTMNTTLLNDTINTDSRSSKCIIL